MQLAGQHVRGNLFGEMLVDALRQQDLVVVQRSGQGDEQGRTQAVVQPAGRNQNRLAHFRQMTADRLLDLGRHHPAAIHLEQIVFPPTVTVGTRLVALEQVAGAVPATCEARLLLFAGPPVTRTQPRATHQQHALPARFLDSVSFAVHQPALIARQRQPGAVGTRLARAVGEEHMADLGSPDAVADLQPVRGPEFELAARQRRAGGKRQAHAAQQLPGLRTQRGIDGRHPKQDPGAEGDQVLQNPLRARPGIVEQRRGSAEPGKEQAVAHAIAEEHLGNRIQPVSRLQCQQLRSERPAETERVAQAVHHPLGRPGGTRGVLQETGCRRVLAMEGTPIEVRRTDQRVQREIVEQRASGGRTQGQRRQRTAQRRCIGFTHHQAGLAVGSDIGQGLLAGLGIDHGGNGADRDAGQEQAGQRRRVVQRQHHAIAGLEQAGQLAGLGENVGPALQPAESLGPDSDKRRYRDRNRGGTEPRSGWPMWT